MFTTAHPRVATPSGNASRAPHHSLQARLGAAITALAVGGALAIVAPLSASAEDRPESYAEGRFLSGTLLGADLSRVVDLGSAEARNNGDQETQTTKDPLDADVLDGAYAVNQPAPQYDLGGVLQIGPVAQYAQANDDGSSIGASGAVADDGAIGIGSDRIMPPANATMDLSALLGDEFADTIADLELTLAAIGARAEGDLDTAWGDYSLAGAELRFTSPAIADLGEKVDRALDRVDARLAQLVGEDGRLIGAVNDLLRSVDPALDLLGGDATVTATIDTGNLRAAVASILSSQFGNGAVAFDLESGDVTIDLAELMGGDLNDLPPSTELLGDAVILHVLSGITGTVSSIADQVVAQVEQSLHAARVDIRADLDTDIAQSPLITEVCENVAQVIDVPVLGSAPLEAILEAIGLGQVGSLVDDVADELGDLVYDSDGSIKQIVGFVQQTVTSVICHDDSSPLPALTTSVDLDVSATVDQLLRGIATTATGEVRVLDVLATGFSVDGVLDDLGAVLTDQLFDGDGAVSELIEALQSGLVEPAVTGLLSADNSVDTALTDLLSVKVNIQEITLAAASGMAVGVGSMFTQTAVRVTALGGSSAVVNLAQATVGPNITQVIDDPDDPGNPGDPDDPTTPSATDRLAFTGVGIATLIAILLALLAAGAYLVRESYLRKHSASGTE